MTDIESTETENTRTMLNQLSNEIFQLKSEKILSDNQTFRKHLLNQLSANTLAFQDLKESVDLLLEKVEVENGEDEDDEDEEVVDEEAEEIVEEKPIKKVKKKDFSLEKTMSKVSNVISGEENII